MKYSFDVFQPLKKAKTILNAQAVQRQAAAGFGLVFPATILVNLGEAATES